jgi:hypothetical protein
VVVSSLGSNNPPAIRRHGLESDVKGTSLVWLEEKNNATCLTLYNPPFLPSRCKDRVADMVLVNATPISILTALVLHPSISPGDRPSLLQLQNAKKYMRKTTELPIDLSLSDILGYIASRIVSSKDHLTVLAAGPNEPILFHQDQHEIPNPKFGTNPKQPAKITAVAFEFTTLKLLEVLASAPAAFHRNGFSCSLDYTFQHFTIGYTLRVLFLRTVDFDKSGNSTISCRPIIIQVNPFLVLFSLFVT